MERDTIKEGSATFTLYETAGKHIPASRSLNGGQEFFSTLREQNGITSETGSIKLHLDFLRAYKNQKEAVEAAKLKWGIEIKIDRVKLDKKYSVVLDKTGPVAVKESFFNVNDGSIVHEQAKILKQGRLGDQDPAYAQATIDQGLKRGSLSQKPCSLSEFRGFQKAQIIPFPKAIKIDLIGERQSRYGEKKLLPENDKNVVGKSQINKDVMNSDDWLKAKAGDFDAAKRVVDSLWSKKKTDQLKELIGDGKDKVFVTMPSTSGFNVLPKVMAEKLAKEFDGKLQVIQGDEFFNLTHSAEVKNISRFDRVFFKRKYKIEKPFDKNIDEKKAVLVDDIFTTGGSVKAFSKELANNKLEVSNVVGLMGDKRFNVDEKTEQKLKSALTDTGIAADTSRLKSLLTRTEAGMLIQRLNREKGLKNEKHRELAKRIQGLYKGIFVKNIRRNRKLGRDKGPGRPHRGNAKNAKGLQGGGARTGQGR